ncbi:MAG: radical SAM protein [Chromatiales bacterium]|nr:radical SAM protein [Chromatiales bacterium]
MFGKKLRFQSPERVAAEIEQCSRRYGIRDFFFHDDTFTVSTKWMAGVQQTFADHHLLDGFRYVANSRVDTFDEEKARLLRAMNVYYILFGIESGSQEILDSMDKGTTLAQAREAFRICQKYGFRTHAYVLLGAPAEDPGDPGRHRGPGGRTQAQHRPHLHLHPAVGHALRRRIAGAKPHPGQRLLQPRLFPQAFEHQPAAHPHPRARIPGPARQPRPHSQTS